MPQELLAQLGEIIKILVVVTAVFLTSLWLGMVLWTFNDIRSRTRDIVVQVVATLMVAVLTLPGLILYFLIRPRETLAEAYERALEQEALLQAVEEPEVCPSCGAKVRADYLYCPYCHTQLKKSCVVCGRILQLDWNLCPYCGAAQGVQVVEPVLGGEEEPPMSEVQAERPEANTHLGGRTGPTSFSWEEKMVLLQAEELTKFYGADLILDGITLTLHRGDRVALVGANGSGKSTLLSILAGQLEADGGTVRRARDLRIGYLPQQADFAGETTLWQAMEAVFIPLLEQAERLRHLERAMASKDEAMRRAALEAYGPLLERFEAGGGFTYEGHIRRTLAGLGLNESHYNRPLSSLSGGERTRALLARLLLEEPELLLLDEPTNHLDLAGIEWLEERLKSWKGALVLVAHDRAFLDALSQRVWSLQGGRIEVYRGNYSAYLKQQAERQALAEARRQARAAEMAKMESYIRRYMGTQRTGQAKGRLKRLQRLEAEAKADRPGRVAPALHLRLDDGERSGDLVLRLRDLSIGYAPNAPLLTVERLELHRGERVALVGPNGSGKTTLVKTILGLLPPLNGRVQLGAAVEIGYFAQVQSHLDPERSVMDTLLEAGMGSLSEIRSFLARYGFRGESVFKRIGLLSGGERARVALALLTLRHANFLLLDEPTNHLDLPSQEVLQEALRAFNGTILLVSHDRYLIRKLATRLWVIQEGHLLDFVEGYSAYERWRKEQRDHPQAKAEAARERRRRWEERRRAEQARKREARRRRERIAALEARITELETRQQALALAIEAAGRRQEMAQVAKLGRDYEALMAELEVLWEKWADEMEETA